MNENKILWVRIDTDRYYNLLLKLNTMGISIFDNKKRKDYILIKTTFKDYKKIKKYLISYKVKINSTAGLFKIKEIICKYKIFIISVIMGILMLFIVDNIIIKIDVKTNNEKIKNLVINELSKNNIKKLGFKKDHNKIEKIVSNILDDNKNVLEWLEIKYDGLIMIVEVVEKTNTQEEKNYKNCNIIASTDAKIISLNINRGVALKEINDYVLKDEIILSGSIIHNEEVKNTVCASGKIYGEVWYKVNLEIPFKENYIYYTGKNRYNFSVKINDNSYEILKSRIKNKKNKVTNLYKLDDFEINLIKEKEFIEKTKILTEKEAYDKGILLALEKINLKLDKNEEVLMKKVLKKDVNNSTIYLEIFVVTKESIGVLQEVREGGNDGVGINN